MFDLNEKSATEMKEQSTEIAKLISKLSEADQERLYYVLKGVELLNEGLPSHSA